MSTINRNMKAANTKAAANVQGAATKTMPNVQGAATKTMPNVQGTATKAMPNVQGAATKTMPNVQGAATKTATMNVKTAATKAATTTSGQINLLRQIQETEFTIYELILYLDTHPDDTFAIEQYNLAVNEHHALHEQYIKQYGPLMQGDPVNSSTWTWGLSDFPWDY